MTQNEMLILGAAILVLALLLLFLLKGRKQRVTLSDTAPAPRREQPRMITPQEIESDLLLQDGGDMTAGVGLAPLGAELAGDAFVPGDPLTTLKGLGPKAAARLNDLGITRYDQLAELDPAQAEALDAQMGAFKGRLTRDRWIEQARLLAAGDTTAFEAAFGKIGG